MTQQMPAKADDLDLFALASIFWRSRYIICLLALIGGLAALVLAFTSRIVFRAEVTVTEVRDSGMGGMASLAGQFGGIASLAGINLGGVGEDQQSIAVLKSRHVAEEFVKRNVDISDLLAGRREQRSLWRAVEFFRKKVVTIREDKRNGTISVAIDTESPQTAARWANAYVALTNEIIRTRAMDDSKRNIAFLNEQIAATTVVELRRAMYNLIEAETKKLMLANGRIEYAFTVVDPAAVSEIRISPKRTLIVLGGIALGAIVGIVIAFWRNMRPEGRRNVAAVEAR